MNWPTVGGVGRLESKAVGVIKLHAKACGMVALHRKEKKRKERKKRRCHSQNDFIIQASRCSALGHMNATDWAFCDLVSKNPAIMNIHIQHLLYMHIVQKKGPASTILQAVSVQIENESKPFHTSYLHLK